MEVRIVRFEYWILGMGRSKGLRAVKGELAKWVGVLCELVFVLAMAFSWVIGNVVCWNLIALAFWS